jgi:dihydrodiol dehydrogenase / D-xylose 1-dehydrogenase (NADP)
MKLRWGIISAGLISQDFCIGLKTLDPNNHSIEAVAARSLGDAKQFAQRFQVSSYFDSYDHVYTHDKVDIVYVGNVNTAHKETCLKAIANGKHVLCEKPMSLNCKEQDEVLEAAKSKGVFFMEGLWTRFFPAIDRLRLELKNDSIGQVKIVQANFFAKINHIDRLSQKALGGGAVLDIGIYPIQYVCLLFNHEMPIEIVASGHLMETGEQHDATHFNFIYQEISKPNVFLAFRC